MPRIEFIAHATSETDRRGVSEWGLTNKCVNKDVDIDKSRKDDFFNLVHRFVDSF